MHAAAALLAAAVTAATPAPPLLGADYNWYAVSSCRTDHGGVLANGAPGRAEIHAQLAAMRAAGIQVLRTFIWNMHDATSQAWGVVSSAGGTMSPGVRRNLIFYLQQVRATGFRELEIVFGPEWSNDPIDPTNPWDPAMFDENWAFIEAVRPLVKRYGPPVTHFDLVNEGAPGDYLTTTRQRVADYDAHLYANYVDAFGNSDVTISAIEQSGLVTLIDALRSTGRPLPTWFELHDYGANLLDDLRATDATLAAKGLTQPVSLGETSYDNAAGASQIASYVATAARPLLEVMPWPLRPNSTCTVPPPYRDDALYSALGESPPPRTLAFAVGRNGAVTARTGAGTPLAGLTAGTYSVTVRNRSKRGLRVVGHLVAPGVSTWTARLVPGTYRYGDRSFAVLQAG